MPTLVHLANEKYSSRIAKNGIKIGKYRHGIYCMPVLPDFYVTHQWIRELKREGGNSYIGVYFKLPSDTKVHAGKYNENHREMKLGEAIKEIRSMNDPLGYELIVERKIEAGEIIRIKGLSQNIGWRYHPDSHGRRPCPCDFCNRGQVKASRVRQKYDPPEKTAPYNELLAKLRTEADVWEIPYLVSQIGTRRKRKSDPAELRFLLDFQSKWVNRELALVLRSFIGPNAKPILIELVNFDDENTKRWAAESLLKLYGNDAAQILESHNDPVINALIEQWREEIAKRTAKREEL